MNFKNTVSKDFYKNTNYINDDIQKYIDQSKFLTNKSSKDELYEKALVSNFLSKDAKVLELGGGWGNVSDMIQKIINNKDNHIIIEPEPKRASDLIKKKL